MTDKLSYIDIFAGCGGLSLGLYNAGLEGLFAVEKNNDAFNTLRYNLIEKNEHFKWIKWLPQTEHDINELLKNYYKQLCTLNQKVQIVVGGPPCQGFSMAGKRDENDSRNMLSSSYLNFVKIIHPRIIFFENVHGFTFSFRKSEINKIPYSKYVANELEKLGYKVKFEMVDLSNFGIPQKRKRFILIGCLDTDPNIFFKKLYSNSDKFLKNKGLTKRITTKDAIGDIQRSRGEVASPDSPRYNAGIYGEATSNYQKLMRVKNNTKKGCAIDSHRFTNHTKEIMVINEKMLRLCPRGKRIVPDDGYVDGFRKRGVTVLDENSQSPTVTSHPDDIIHYNEPRILTVRELARLQSFPDWYEFKGKYTTGGNLRKIEVPRFTQVGNAIPPLFAEQVGLVLKEMLSDG